MDDRLHVSQYGQCKIIDELCYPNINDTNYKGYFIEVGAYDGYHISNTYWFEKMRDWKGLLVEPVPVLTNQIRHNRWSDIYEGCVYIYDGKVDYIHIEGYSQMISGIPEGYHQKHYERVSREIEQHGQKVNNLSVNCVTLNTLIKMFNTNNNRPRDAVIDYLSLDCQTAELDVLNNYDFKENPCKVINLDMNGINTPQLIDWFRDNGFRQHWKHQYADEYIFVNDSIKWSWE